MCRKPLREKSQYQIIAVVSMGKPIIGKLNIMEGFCTALHFLSGFLCYSTAKMVCVFIIDRFL